MRILALFVIALCAGTAAAQMYSWKDADGKVHYSDQPPPSNTPARKVAPATAPSTNPTAARQSFVEQEADSRKKQKEAQEAAKKAETDQANAEAKRVNCERARASLQGIESGQVRFTTGANGERIGLDGAARDAELANARSAVDNWCN
jgi:hypothetical protein